MNRKKIVLIGVAAIVLLLVIVFATTYNSLVNKDEKVRQQWSEVQNTYQRRLDLLPNLVNIVKGISGFEQGVLEEIANARAKALSGMTSGEPSATDVQNQVNLQDSVAAATNRVIAVIEKYPTLKGTDAYAGLQTQLEGTERRIKVARNDFNAAVADYNTAVRSSVTGLTAKLFGFKVKDGFAATAGSQAVEIKF